MLERIQKENDIKKLNSEELECLAGEIREFLVEKVSKTGGHLASNLGVVELTMALHLICDLPKDKIIWDVGHQSYTHKLLTGRKEGFEDLRSYGGMSGFPKRKESQCDAFDTGHSSTSISAGLGYVRARDLKHEDYTVISVIGDGSLTGGMAYEALNNASNLKTNFIVVLNDNHMSISENVGGMSRYLANLRTADIYTGLKKGVTNALQQVPVMGDRMIEHIRKTKSSIKQLMVPGMFFEDMGITYLGPIPGHNLPMLCKALKEAKKVEGPVLLHVMTTKGKGYEPAETAPDKFHGIGPFDIESGKVLAKKDGDTYTATAPDYITNNEQKTKSNIALETYATDLKQTQVRLTYNDGVADKEPKVLKPKQILFERPQTITFSDKDAPEKYYVYGHGDIQGVYTKAGDAIKKANDYNGVVVDSSQNYVWERGNRNLQYSITDKDDVLNTIKDRLKNQEKPIDILKDVNNGEAYDLTGCTTEEILYIINQGRPVIAMLDSQNAVILVGYSDTNVVYEDLNDSTRHSVKYEEMDQMTSGSGNTYIG